MNETTTNSLGIEIDPVDGQPVWHDGMSKSRYFHEALSEDEVARQLAEWAEREAEQLDQDLAERFDADTGGEDQ